MTVPATGVKEQTTGVYAQKLAEQGFLTCAFDPAGWGESTGRRFIMNPYTQHGLKLDIWLDRKCSFLTLLQYINKPKI
ncbi:MAG: hypothetical protein AAF702_11700 [Chloroflexota bacterium]